MNRKPSIGVAVVAALGAVVGLGPSACSSKPPVLEGAGGGGGSGGQAGNTAVDRDASLGGSGGSSDPVADAPAVTIRTDVIPAWWYERDAWGPEIATTPTVDSNCGIVQKETSRQPVDVLLLIDRSGSMQYSLEEDCYCSEDVAVPGAGSLCRDTTNCTTRWSAVVSALKQTLTSTSYVHWGLKFFPSVTVADGGNQCTVNEDMEVTVAADAATPIQSAIDGAQFASATPTAVGVKNATTYLRGLTDGNKKFILLATDGAPNCRGNNVANTDVPGATDACAAALAAEIPVYVIGIGPSVTNLSALAQAGGTKDYYPVSSPEQLAQALSDISGVVGSCIYQADAEPPDPENVAVYVNKQKIEKGAADGWKYGASTKDIELTGRYCQDITDGKQTAVQILFGCPGTPPFDPFLP